MANAIYVWGLARAAGGRVLLRIEDHDRVRCTPAFEHAILDDLDWLGFVADGGAHPPHRQSDTYAAYESALAALERQGLVYGCDCSRARIGSGPYDGHCQDRRLPPRAGRGLRVRLDPGVETAHDVWAGPIVQTPAAQCGDLLVRDRLGQWTYQFAAAVDDLRQGVTLVVRGADLLESTGRQVALARLLGRARPAVFAHHPLILRPDGRKLSKSAGDTGLRELRDQGASPAAVIGRAAAGVGLIDGARPLTASEIPAIFDRAGPTGLPILG